MRMPVIAFTALIALMSFETPCGCITQMAQTYPVADTSVPGKPRHSKMKASNSRTKSQMDYLGKKDTGVTRGTGMGTSSGTTATSSGPATPGTVAPGTRK